jgi:ribosome-associated protein
MVHQRHRQEPDRPGPVADGALEPGAPLQPNLRIDPTAAATGDGDRDELDDRPSKSQRKRDMHALQDLGERLIALQPERLRRMDIPGKLLDAIELAQRITSREGRRRQLQYVGRLMRDVDAQAIRDQVDLDGRQHRIDTAIQHAAERWREVLVEAPTRLGEFVERYPRAADAGLDRAIESARTEVGRGERGRRYRELFRKLRDTMVDTDGGTR